jgi:centromeric protein E
MSRIDSNPMVTPSMKLLPQHSRSAAPPQEFHYDEVLTGSDNKSVYNAVARSHISAAMDGYNAVVFAYGQTASGKTYTLVSRYLHCGILLRRFTSFIW